MARPSKLTPAQWAEVDRRQSEGEGVRKLALEYRVSPATISKRGVWKQSGRVQLVAQKLADAQSELAGLSPPQQYLAMSLADKLRNISDSVASAAELGAKTGHRLHALANSEVARVDDAQPSAPESMKSLQTASVLTKLGNEALAPAMNLLSANKDRINPVAVEPEKVSLTLDEFYR